MCTSLGYLGNLKFQKLDYVSIEYVIPRCGTNPSAHAVLNAPIYASSHDVHVRPFTIGYIQHLLKKNCPLGFDFAGFRQKVPWERSRVAFSEVIFGETIGRTDKLSRSC